MHLNRLFKLCERRVFWDTHVAIYGFNSTQKKFSRKKARKKFQKESKFYEGFDEFIEKQRGNTYENK